MLGYIPKPYGNNYTIRIGSCLDTIDRLWSHGIHYDLFDLGLGHRGSLFGATGARSKNTR